MKLMVLISCMHRTDTGIISESNVQTDSVVVNQCDRDSIEEFDFKNKKGRTCHVKFINTTERGLSNSRNMAILNATNADICYMCDDDEFLADDYEDTIVSAYEKYPYKSIITFSLIRKDYTYPTKAQKMGIKQILKTSSVQTTFRRDDILKCNIFFDPKMGSGSGNGGGEENKFLMDCKRAGLKLWYVPQIIASVKTENSQWFHGFTEDYYSNVSWANRRILGKYLGALYMTYWVLFRRNNFKQELSFASIVRACLKGFFEER